MMIPTDAQREAIRQRPAGRAAMYQTWSDLLFLNWRVDAAALQETLPDGLFIDTFDGSGWLGIVPFQMRHIRPAGLPAVPWISYFLELNVRTYVHDRHGNPGVWFYSLDTNRWIAYKIARTVFKLPYFPAVMGARRDHEGFMDYHCRRTGTGDATEAARYRYRAGEGAAQEATPGTLEFFLLERYALFSHDPVSKRIYSGQVNHTPYQFRPAEVPQWDTAPAIWNGLPDLSGPPAHVCMADPVDVSVFGLKTVE